MSSNEVSNLNITYKPATDSFSLKNSNSNHQRSVFVKGKADDRLQTELNKAGNKPAAGCNAHLCK
jgi:hypothetical protein